MKKTILALTTCISIPSFADVPNTFVAGDIATAEAFNQNFQTLDSSIKNLDTKTDEIKSQVEAIGAAAYHNASVNGLDMKVRSTSIGGYNIRSLKGFNLDVDVDGIPLIYAYKNAVFENENCSGQPYRPYGYLHMHRDKSINYTFKNPKISTSYTWFFDGSNLFYGIVGKEIIKLHSKSILSHSRCQNVSATYIAYRLLPNDINITGFNNPPYIIKNIGSSLTITEEIGSPD